MTEQIEAGFCQCGCGQLAPKATRTHNKLGWKRGMPKRFIQGHYSRIQNIKGDQNPQWKGGKIINRAGYISFLKHEHPRSDMNGYIPEHILIIEKALEKPIPEKATSHHVNSRRDDNSPGNLVLCENQAYHLLLHQRTNALKACGHADWRKCVHCKEYDDPKNLYINNSHGWHRECMNIYHKRLRDEKRKQH